jgi:hypothetical protein
MARYLSALMVVLAGLAASAPAAGERSVRDTVFLVQPNGAVVHGGSGLRFPMEVAGFRRAGSAVFDTSGQYVGVRYVRPLDAAARVELRIAVVHIVGMAPREHYVIAKPMALRGLSEVRVLLEGPSRRLDRARGYRGLFEGRRNGRRVMVGLWAFDRGVWSVRARAEFPARYRAQADSAVGDFVGAIGAANRDVRVREP